MPPVATIRTAERHTVTELPDVPAPVSLLDQLVVGISTTTTQSQTARLDQFLASRDVAEALKSWFGELPDLQDESSRSRVAIRLNSAVSHVDGLLTRQLQEILHHKEFQKLEAAWRGLKYLVEQVPDGANVKIRLLQASWRDLVKDQERALEFDQSQLFRKVYSDEFGTPGGEPFGLLIGNYDICHRPYADHPTDDLAALRGIANVAAASFAPFIAGVDSRFFELDSFAELEPTIDIARTFDRLEYIKWNSLRESEDARFLGLVIPKIVLRQSYGDTPSQTHRFQFQEDVSAPNRSGYLWGNGAFAFGAVAVRTFGESAWLAEIRGVRSEAEDSGVVHGLPVLTHGPKGFAQRRSITDVQITDRQEKELGDHGFVPLCHIPGSDMAAFYSVPSIQKPKTYDDPSATANARLSSMLQYMLCVSRIAHYIKVIIRDRVGSFTSPQEVQDDLHNWLAKYVVNNDSASHEMKAKYPLREARVEVREIEDKPGTYRCAIYLRPHFQLDQLSAGIKLTTQLGGSH